MNYHVAIDIQGHLVFINMAHQPTLIETSVGGTSTTDVVFDDEDVVRVRGRAAALRRKGLRSRELAQARELDGRLVVVDLARARTLTKVVSDEPAGQVTVIVYTAAETVSVIEQPETLLQIGDLGYPLPKRR